MIRVSRDRFYEIFKDDKYESRLQGGFRDRSSCPIYNIIDTVTNEIVGDYTDGSWENTYEVVIDLCSKEDVVNHYEKINNELKNRLGRQEKAYKELKDYNKLSWYAKLKVKYDKWKKARYRKKHPGLLSFLENDNVIEYKPNEFNLDIMANTIKEVWDIK